MEDGGENKTMVLSGLFTKKTKKKKKKTALKELGFLLRKILPVKDGELLLPNFIAVPVAEFIRNMTIKFPYKPNIVFGFTTDRYLLIDKDHVLKSEYPKIKEKLIEIAKRGYGNFLIVKSSETVFPDSGREDSYNLNVVYGKDQGKDGWEKKLFPEYKRLCEEGFLEENFKFFIVERGDMTLRVSTKGKYSGKGVPQILEEVHIDGNRKGIEEYLEMVRIAEEIEKEEGNTPTLSR